MNRTGDVRRKKSEFSRPPIFRVFNTINPQRSFGAAPKQRISPCATPIQNPGRLRDTATVRRLDLQVVVLKTHNS